MFRAIKRLFIWLGLAAEKATENDAINQAVVERGIRDSKAKADKAHYANGQLAGQIALLRDQVKRQERQRNDLQGMLQAAAAANDEANGAHYAEELASLVGWLGQDYARRWTIEETTCWIEIRLHRGPCSFATVRRGAQPCSTVVTFAFTQHKKKM